MPIEDNYNLSPHTNIILIVIGLLVSYFKCFEFSILSRFRTHTCCAAVAPVPAPIDHHRHTNIFLGGA